MTVDFTFAEQSIDRQARTEIFEGRQIELVTGRVLLHALDVDGRPVCGHDLDPLTPIRQSWNAQYLPHLPRCRDCVTALIDAGHPQREPGFGRAAPQATGVDIRTAHGTGNERAAAAALRRVLAGRDLRPWMFTDVVIVDEEIRGGFSHPMTISPGLLIQRPALALTTFLHEQLHWIEGPATDSATAEASERWPDPPPLPGGGGRSPQSTWLHMSVCALEYLSLSKIIGQYDAVAELAQHRGYSWIYGQIIADPAWFCVYLHRHGLGVPEQPPVPRRYFGDAWWTKPSGLQDRG
jgi:hypothetical protein